MVKQKQINQNNRNKHCLEKDYFAVVILIKHFAKIAHVASFFVLPTSWDFVEVVISGFIC